MSILFHRFASAFPLLDSEQLGTLADDIREHGQREPIRTYGGEVLDGRNRFLACEALGVDPWMVESDAQTDEAALAESISCNLHRRHLTTSQRAMVGVMLEPMFAELAKARQVRKPADSVPAEMPEQNREAREDAAEAVNVSPRSIQNAKRVTEHGTPELQAAVVAGGFPVTTAADAARLEPDEQREILAAVDAGEKPAAAVKAHVAHNSGNNEWYTPPKFIEAARVAMGGIDCDPASSEIANQTVRAPTFYTAETNGLDREWGRRVWLNPPYSMPLLRDFCESMARRFVAGEIEAACVLVNNATETRVFQTMLVEAAAVCFPKGRIKYHDATGKPAKTPLQGQAVLYFGPDKAKFSDAFREIGAVLYVVP